MGILPRSSDTGGQTPNILEKAFSWDTNLTSKGKMFQKVEQMVWNPK